MSAGYKKSKQKKAPIRSFFCIVWFDEKPPFGVVCILAADIKVAY